MNNFELDIKKTDFSKDEKTGKKSSSISFKGFEAIILHPSFCCPVIAEKEKPISIFLLTGDDFHKAYSAEIKGGSTDSIDKDGVYNAPSSEGVLGGGACKRAINQSLIISKWDKVSDHANIEESDPKTIYPSFDEARDNITVTYISELSSPAGIKDKNGTVFANIRQSAFDRFKNDLQVKHLFQVDLVNLNLDSETLYDLSWITLNDNKFFPEPADDNYIKSDLDSQKLFEIQDQDTKKFIIEHPKKPEQKHLTHAYDVDSKEFTFEVDENTPIQNHHPLWIAPSGKKKLSIGQLSDPHISARQFAYCTSKAQIIPGKDEKGNSNSPPIGDLVNNNYYAFKDLMDQVGNDDEIDILIITGDLVDHHRNYNPKSKFFSGKETTTGTIWDQMTLKYVNETFKDGEDVGKEMYPAAIDNVIIYSLFQRFYKKYNKPIFVVAGNHEFYNLPYGISPRLKTGRALWNFISGFFKKKTKQEIMEDSVIHQAEVNKKRINTKKDEYTNANKANDGIPADTNLTFYEATLMYGPDYNHIPAAGTFKSNTYNNFTLETGEWFFQIFTPLSDYFFRYNDQTFIGLEWGDDERIIFTSADNQVDFGDSSLYILNGVLPRACESISDKQKEIITNAITEEYDTKDQCNILFTHFTYTAFFPSEPHCDTGITNIKGKYEFGTFHKNKDYIHLDLIKNNKLQYTLSGHTHRPGLYQLTNEPVENCKAKENGFGETTNGGDQYVKPAGIHAISEHNLLYTGIETHKTKMLVSSCSGPTGKYNANDELYGLGMDYPSGAYIKFTQNEERVGMIRTSKSIKSSKPRFAVALEYADIVGAEKHKSKHGIFKLLKLSEDGSEIMLELNPDLKLPNNGNNLINSIDLFFVKKNKIQNKFLFVVNRNNQEIILLNTGDSDKKSFKGEISENIDEFDKFVSCKFNSLSKYKEFSHYDFDTPLIIPVELTDNKGLIEDKYENLVDLAQDELGVMQSMVDEQIEKEDKANSGFLITRDKIHGEVPDHYSLSKSGDHEYEEYPWDGETDPGK